MPNFSYYFVLFVVPNNSRPQSIPQLSSDQIQATDETPFK